LLDLGSSCKGKDEGNKHKEAKNAEQFIIKEDMNLLLFLIEHQDKKRSGAGGNGYIIYISSRILQLGYRRKWLSSTSLPPGI
jgi:hypothetical protein